MIACTQTERFIDTTWAYLNNLLLHQAEKEKRRKKKHLDFLDILLEAKVKTLNPVSPAL